MCIRDRTETLVKRWPDRPVHRMWQVVVGGSLARALMGLGDQKQAATVLREVNESLDLLEKSVDPQSPIGEKVPEIASVLRDLSESNLQN